MKKLAPGYHYRLRMLTGRARPYKPDAVMKRLERLGLVEATGRIDHDGRKVEYAITEKGRAVLRDPGSDA